MKNKKGQVGATLTWIVGFLIIFFIMFLFMGFSISLSGKKKVGLELEEGRSYLVLTKQLVSFLNTEIEIEGEKTSMYDLILDSRIYENFRKDGVGVLLDKEKMEGEEFKEAVRNSEIFKKEAENIFSKIIPFLFYGKAGEKFFKEEAWQLIILGKGAKKFASRLNLGFYDYFAAGNLGLCVEGEVIYSEIKLNENLDLFLCVNVKELEDRK